MANRFYFITLIFLVLFFGYLTYLVFKPFLLPIAWAVVLSVMFYPVYVMISRYLSFRSLTAFIVLSIILLFIIGPVSYLSYTIVKEMKALADYAEQGKLEALRGSLEHPSVRVIFEWTMSVLNITEEELNKAITNNMARPGQEIARGIGKGIWDILTGLINFLFMAVSIFFFLKKRPALSPES